MQPLDDAIDTVARDSGFTGVVRVDRAGTTEFAKAYGLADRAHEIANAIHTRFALASGAKG
ncbi:MAG: serine hydrolase, partial [Actinomycetota bacterium]